MHDASLTKMSWREEVDSLGVAVPERERVSEERVRERVVTSKGAEEEVEWTRAVKEIAPTTVGGGGGGSGGGFCEGLLVIC